MLSSLRDLDRQVNLLGLCEEYKKLAEQPEPVEETQKSIESGSTKDVDTQYVVVTRFKGEIEWLRLQGINAEIMPRVYNAEQLEGKIVIGFVPDHLICKASQVWHIFKPWIKNEQRGQDLTAQELIAAGATFDKYIPARKVQE